MVPFKKAALLTAVVACVAAQAFAFVSRTSDSFSSGTSTPLFLVGRVAVHDPRILDVTGNYLLEGSQHEVELNLIQDPRGMLRAFAYVSRPDSETSVAMRLNGRLNVASTGPLTMQLGNAPMILGLPRLGTSANLVTTRPIVTIAGPLQGPAFRLMVNIRNVGTTETFVATLEPVKRARGFMVADGAPTRVAPNVFRSLRRLNFPWGSTSLPAVQNNGPGSRITFRIPDWQVFTRFLFAPFHMNLIGTATEGEFVVTRNTVRLGYGLLEVRPENTVVFESEPVTSQ
jgi:hypothetical protein